MSKRRNKVALRYLFVIFLYIAGKMLAKIDKSLHIINKANWHMICHSFYGDYLMQRKAKRG
ncbi:hypothetical protein EBC44_15235 [Salmonella enterica subsp. enterica]|uniref:Uncharacterized protein n=1 Tax=Salmonella enterica subsp. enterica serovar Napoli TaxID=1151001 RepID=A0A5I5V4G1_SALET|nr:hypothetical protein [Salmonella enterica subsp. enterica serovar Napoli]EAC0524172.1 hypothetical protein [Salmonella enterica subsp. enterica serovar Zaiman]EAU6664198.1 hypothetical protein [Salmonella enterica]EAB5585695.1 hypothetical protein [Salmonella enterica subsp. enterica serovar Napoli]EBQ9574486.1 hypothetical protein [Salmonella enterica subsp. enterica serovar Napoli]